MFVESGAEIKADPFSLESLIAWLEKQPADKKYCYTSVGHCLLAQYFKGVGYGPQVIVGTTQFHEFGGGEVGGGISYPAIFDEIAVAGYDTGTDSWDGRTFGAALARARVALADHLT